MEIDPILCIVVGGSVGALLIERVFYYKSKYKKKEIIPVNPGEPENPSHGERLVGLETDMENFRSENEKDHRLIRQSIEKLSTQINGLRK